MASPAPTAATPATTGPERYPKSLTVRAEAAPDDLAEDVPAFKELEAAEAADPEREALLTAATPPPAPEVSPLVSVEAPLEAEAEAPAADPVAPVAPEA